ncbi:MAG: type II secretion system F family protein [Myxococcales bacterium]|nr:type II secretion system F family protein [Myxococcales bacterium]
MDPMRLWVLLLVFSSVAMVSLVAFDVVRKGYARYEERFVEETSATLDQMFVFFNPRRIWQINIAITVLFAVVGFLVSFYWLVAVVAGLAGFILPRVVMNILYRRRQRLFENQLVAGLESMSNALKAGLTLIQAMEILVKEHKPPISQEFALVLREHKLGVSLDEALEHLTYRVFSDDLELMVVSTVITRSTGGNLTEIYDQLSRMVRRRQEIEEKIKSSTAQGKMQGLVVGGAPILMALALYLISPSLIEPFWQTNIGWIAMMVMVIMEVAGMILIKNITAIEI